MSIFGSIEELAGNTPLLELKRFSCKSGITCRLFGKLEFYNPSGSVKDRAAARMLVRAEAEGKINKSSVIIEPTSGNFGISLAALCAVRGLRAVIVMPADMSEERKKILKYFGAEVVLTDPENGMKGAAETAEKLRSKMKNGVILGQFSNTENARAHYMATAPEIWNDLNGEIDFLFIGAGTGGTLAGCYKYFKEKNPLIKIFAVEPSASPVLSGGKGAPHGIQGIGAGFVPELLKDKPYDSVVRVPFLSALQKMRSLAQTEGVFAGISSGAVLHAAAEVCKGKKSQGKTAAVILPDGGFKYLSVTEKI